MRDADGRGEEEEWGVKRGKGENRIRGRRVEMEGGKRRIRREERRGGGVATLGAYGRVLHENCEMVFEGKDMKEKKGGIKANVGSACLL